jgi:hypothetical protein
LLKIDIRVGESVKIGNFAVITLDDKSGKIARLSIDADKSILVSRVTGSSVAQIAATSGIGAVPGRSTT